MPINHKFYSIGITYSIKKSVKKTVEVLSKSNLLANLEMTTGTGSHAESIDFRFKNQLLGHNNRFAPLKSRITSFQR